jgi:hypothetical protein
MTLSQEFEDALRSVTGPQAVAARVPPRSVRCDLSEVTSLAVNVGALTLETSELATAGVDQLEDLSRELSARVNYLLEPIGPVEIDADACTVQMRSMPPQKDDDGRNYYELLVRRGGELSLHRYRKEPGQPRTAIPATLTREVLVRLVGDFCAVLDGMA